MIYLELFFVFFMIGLFTIGGGYAMIPMIEDQVVARGWLTKEGMLNFFAIAESTPGPFAVNTATLVGFNLGSEYGLFFGIFGAIITTLAVILPSFLIILLIAKYIKNFLKYKQVQWAIIGVKAIVVGLLFSVVYDLILTNVFGGEYNFQNFDYIALGIMILIFVMKKMFKKTHPIVLIIISGIFGILFYGLFPLLIKFLGE